MDFQQCADELISFTDAAALLGIDRSNLYKVKGLTRVSVGKINLLIRAEVEARKAGG